MTLRERLRGLARVRSEASPVVTLYLDTRWTDEHQRERARVFLDGALDRARRGAPAATVRGDLDWVEGEARARIDQTVGPGVSGLVVFACGPAGLREAFAVEAVVPDVLVLDARPFLRPLADVAEAHPPALLAVVDGERARLLPLGVDGAAPEAVTLESAVEGHHRRGGWALLAQSRYANRLENQRSRHLDAVAEAIGSLAGVEQIVLAGEPGVIAALQTRLPRALAARVAGTMRAAQHEPAGALAARARALLEDAERREERESLDAVLVEAAKGGRATAGVAATLDAVGRDAVHRLYVLKSYHEPGTACDHCGALVTPVRFHCPLCGQATRTVELGEAMVERVLRGGGTVETVAEHAALDAVGGVAARLRWPV
jgi:peptide chain release factor subunit 1